MFFRCFGNQIFPSRFSNFEISLISKPVYFEIKRNVVTSSGNIFEKIKKIKNSLKRRWNNNVFWKVAFSKPHSRISILKEKNPLKICNLTRKIFFKNRNYPKLTIWDDNFLIETHFWWIYDFLMDCVLKIHFLRIFSVAFHFFMSFFMRFKTNKT